MAVKACLEYAQRQRPDHEGEKYYTMSYMDANGFPWTNYEYDTIENIDIHDIRSGKFTLAENGMEIVSFKSCLENEGSDDTAKMEGQYLNEVTSLISKKTGSEQVFIFEYLVRKRDASFPFLGKEPFGNPQPATAVHIDHSPEDVRDRIRQIFKEDANTYLTMNYKVINVWKPIKGPVHDWPMAFCDRSTVDYVNDIVAIDDVHPNYVNEVLNVHYNPDQKWYFAPYQHPEEAIVFVEYDSGKTGRGVPHCAFEHEKGENIPKRESVEVRALVFF